MASRIFVRAGRLISHWRNEFDALFPQRYLANASQDMEADEAASTKSWKFRMAEMLACPDMAALEHTPNGGAVGAGFQTMHNGIKIPLGSYYGRVTAAVFHRTKGVHEPQEERIFGEFLRRLKADSTAPTMMELGAYWGFYSAWFAQTFPQGRSVLVEPMWQNMQYGLKTFKLNGLKCDHVRALIGDSIDQSGKLPLVTVDWLMEHFQVQTLDVLHSDIQGYEGRMLRGASKALAEKRIRVVFVSTHSDHVHAECTAFLEGHGYVIGLSLPQRDSYAYDGLLVAARPADAALVQGFEVSRRSAVHPTDNRGWQLEPVDG